MSSIMSRGWQGKVDIMMWIWWWQLWQCDSRWEGLQLLLPCQRSHDPNPRNMKGPGLPSSSLVSSNPYAAVCPPEIHQCWYRQPTSLTGGEGQLVANLCTEELQKKKKNESGPYHFYHKIQSNACTTVWSLPGLFMKWDIQGKLMRWILLGISLLFYCFSSLFHCCLVLFH